MNKLKLPLNKLTKLLFYWQKLGFILETVDGKIIIIKGVKNGV